MSRWPGKAAVIAIPALIAAGVGLWLYFSPNSPPPAEASSGQDRPHRFPSSAPKDPGLAASDWSGTPLTPESLPKLSRTKMSPELARELLKRAKTEITGIENRADFSAAVLSSLGKQGHGEEAWALVEEESGMVRKRQLAILFREDSAPLDSLIARLKDLTMGSERVVALGWIFDLRPKEATGFDFNQISFQSPEEMFAFSEGISKAIAESKRQDAGDTQTARILLEKCADLAARGSLSDNHFAYILRADSATDSFTKWDLVGDLKDRMPPDQIAKFQKSVVSQMIDSDAGRCMSLLCSASAGTTDPAVFASAISHWYRRDSKAARDWISRHAENLAPAAGDGVKTGAVRIALEHREYAIAREWAALIADRTGREALENTIRAAESPDSPEGR